MPPAWASVLVRPQPDQEQNEESGGKNTARPEAGGSEPTARREACKRVAFHGRGGWRLARAAGSGRGSLTCVTRGECRNFLGSRRDLALHLCWATSQGMRPRASLENQGGLTLVSAGLMTQGGLGSSAPVPAMCSVPREPPRGQALVLRLLCAC